MSDVEVGPEGKVCKVGAGGQKSADSSSASVTSNDEMLDEWAVVPKSRTLFQDFWVYDA